MDPMKNTRESVQSQSVASYHGDLSSPLGEKYLHIQHLFKISPYYTDRDILRILPSIDYQTAAYTCLFLEALPVKNLRCKEGVTLISLFHNPTG